MTSAISTGPLQARLLDDVLGLCAQLLKLAPHQLDGAANFFACGGNSLQALQLCALLEQRHPQLWGEDGIDLTLIVGTASLGEFVTGLLRAAHSEPRASMLEGEL
ncbi:phosphopantetheine-binding protein [Pseudomonas saponiphila]|uniref:phosphopantetheine-binding protein n=1 Tax=Pseudomonas saponiphila TaxID=556534 RepID=UPI00223EDFB5|nr:phosphopantetheine-binding protein [Pseudomonas saponiphila]